VRAIFQTNEALWKDLVTAVAKMIHSTKPRVADEEKKAWSGYDLTQRLPCRSIASNHNPKNGAKRRSQRTEGCGRSSGRWLLFAHPCPLIASRSPTTLCFAGH
jgi:hypothetical protein